MNVEARCIRSHWHASVLQCAGCLKTTLAWKTASEAVESTATQPPIFD